MGLFDLPFLKRRKKAESYYLGLFLREHEGHVYALERTPTGLKLAAEETFAYTNGWNHLVEDVDQVLVKLETRVPVHFTETIFFIESEILDPVSGEIKKHYLTKIKELVKNLELKALGYIECFEAVVNFLQKRDDLPLTAVVIELDVGHMTVFVYKGGRAVLRKTVERSSHVAADLTHLFDEAKAKNILLPSKIVLYGSKSIDHEASLLMAHKWTTDFFVQPPKVETIHEDEIRNDLISVFESQLNRDQVVEKPELAKEAEPQEVMGFVVGRDVEPRSSSVKEEELETVGLEVEAAANIKMPLFSRLKEKLSAAGSLFTKKKLRLNLLVVAGTTLVFIALFLNEYMLHTGVLKIFLPAKGYEKTVTLRAAEDRQSDVPLMISTQSAELTRSAPATGSREVGEKAKGEMTLYSFDSQPRTIGKNTVLTYESLRFLTSQDVQVASASEAFVGGNLVKQPGKVKVEVVAEEIGSQYNVEKGKRFSVGDLSQTIYFGQNDVTFSGGTKKTVKTVARQDLDGLETALLNQVSSAEGTLLTIDNPALKSIPTLTSAELTNVRPSKEVGEEADRVTLSATGVITYYLYDDNKLKEAVMGQFRDEIPEGFSLKKDSVAYAIEAAQVGDEYVTLDLSAKVKAIQDIPTDQILSNIAFKSPQDLDNMLKKEYKVAGYEINIKNPIPFLKDRTPLFPKNLVILISSL